MLHPTDRKTRVAVRASYLGTALNALRGAILVTDDDTERAHLTQLAADVALAGRKAGTEFADIRTAEARLVTAALEG